jgi:regulator of protease activity HflC (stomatin/prohibitin superfamily)
MSNETSFPIGWLIAVVVAFLFVIVAIGSCSSLNRTGPTEVALIRNGGPFDNKSIREVRPPSQGYKVSGLASEVRKYIAGNEQRYYKVSSDPSLGSESGSDFIKVPTKDGVNVEVDAQISFRTNFTNEGGELTPCDCPNEKGDQEYEWLLEKFDTNYGNRNYRAKDGDQLKVWEGNDGWNAFLDSIFRPVVENAFREQVGSVNCADLVSSCALVQSSSQDQSVAFTGADNRKNFERIQNSVQAQIDEGVESALGTEYLTGFKVQLTKVSLPQKVQDAIDDAQASFAKIAEARAGKIQADYQAEANERLAAAYRGNPILGYIKAIESLKDSTATIIVGEPGTGLNIGR